MLTAARFAALSPLALLAAPASAQRVEVSGWVAPRCFAVPAGLGEEGMPAHASVRCTGPRPALTVTTRPSARPPRIAEAAREGRPAADGDAAPGPRVEIVVSPAL